MSGVPFALSLNDVLRRMARFRRDPACRTVDGAEAARFTLGCSRPGGPAPAQDQVLIDAGRSAFLSALHLCAMISVVGSLALALFVAVTLRRIKRSPE